MRYKIFLAAIFLLNLNFSPAAYAANSNSDLQRLENLSIQECLNLALENHPSLRKAKGSTRAAAAQLEQAKVKNRATLSATGSLRYDGNYEKWDDRYHSQSAGVTASKLLYDTGRNKLQQEIQNQSLKSAKENERGTQVSVAAAAKRAYYDLMLKILNRDVEREKLNSLEEHLKTAQGLYEVGNSAFIDVTKAEADVASAKTSLLKSENDILISQQALLVAMGINNIPTGFDFNLILSGNLLLPKIESDINFLLNTALEDRPDFKQSQYTIKARELSIKDAARSGSPTITGQLSSNYSKREAQSSSENYGAGISINIPIVDGGAAKAAVELARAQLDQAGADHETLRQQITYGVRSAALSLANAVERAKSSELSVKYAEENLELARGRYEVGVGTPLELSDAVSSLANARYAYYQALYDAQTSRADLDEALGHLPLELSSSTSDGLLSQ